MNVELPDHMVNNLGKTVFTGLVFVKDGKLQVMVPIVDTEDDDEPAWLGETFDSPAAIAFAAELEAKGAGGGSA